MDILKALEVQEETDVKKLERRDFTEIRPKENLSVSDARSFFDGLFQEMHDKEKDYYTSYECFILGKHTARNGVAGISPPRREFQKC